MQKRLIMLVRHEPKGLHGAEKQDAAAAYGSGLEYQVFDPGSPEEHHANVLRHRPLAVIMPREPLGVKKALPFMPKEETRGLTPHKRFVYTPHKRFFVNIDEPFDETKAA